MKSLFCFHFISSEQDANVCIFVFMHSHTWTFIKQLPSSKVYNSPRNSKPHYNTSCNNSQIFMKNLMNFFSLHFPPYRNVKFYRDGFSSNYSFPPRRKETFIELEEQRVPQKDFHSSLRQEKLSPLASTCQFIVALASKP